MSVRYIRVKPIADLFSPVIRPTGNVAIVGTAEKGVDNVPLNVTSPAEAAEVYGDARRPVAGQPGVFALNSSLTASIELAFGQSPGPSQVWAVKAEGAATDAVADPTAALTAVEALNVQFVVLARTPLAGGADGAIG